MLAVQRPRMGSSNPPNPNMPFGFSFDDPSNFPYPAPTAPAPGPSLLDDNESKFLDSFFDGVSSDHFNYDSYTHPSAGSDLGFAWEELPPAFMGTTSSYGQPAMPQMGMHTPGASTEVLAAASALQNGSNGRANSEVSFHPPNSAAAKDQSRRQTLSQYPPSNSIRPSGAFMREGIFAENIFGFGDHIPRSLGHKQASQAHSKGDLRWGSDIGFATSEVFTPPPAEEKEVAASNRDYVKIVTNAFLETQAKGLPRASSPSKNNQDEDDAEGRPRKRRKSKFNDSDDEQLTSPTSRTTAVASRAPVKKESTPPRRKSSVVPMAAKSRENLTEDQKRENHIKSEQKRRTLIREGFDDLGELVPGLRGGGFSKSAVLTMAADWMEDLLKGNEALRQQLSALGG